MKKSYFLCLFVFFSVQFIFAHSEESQLPRPDDHAPISVMAEHVHKSRDFMFSYRLMNMQMSGYIQNRKLKSSLQLSNEDTRYKISATDMKMTMHMFGMMVGVADFLTFMMMVNLIENKMKMYSTSMGEHKMNNFGLADGSLSFLFRLFHFEKKHSLHFQLGTIVPYGNFTNNDHPSHNHSGENNSSNTENLRSTYAMQLGGGTWSPIVSLTYRGKSKNFSWGLQPSAILRLYKNTEGWSFGNQYNLKTWLAGKLNFLLSSSLSLDVQYKDKIIGEDDNLQLNTPTRYTENYGGLKIYFGYGMNFYLPLRWHENTRLAFEFKLPVYLGGNGVQMKEDYIFIFGFQYDFNLKLYQ